MSGDALTPEEKRARLLEARAKKDAADEQRKLDAEFARLELAERLEKELGGPEGQQFAIYDATGLGEGLFAVKLGPSVLWKAYWDSKMTDVDKCDLVTQCIAYPTKEEYLAARGRRMAIDTVLVTYLGRLNGLNYEIQEKK